MTWRQVIQGSSENEGSSSDRWNLGRGAPFTGTSIRYPMEPKYRTLLQAAVLITLLAVIVYHYEPAPEPLITAEMSVR